MLGNRLIFTAYDIKTNLPRKMKEVDYKILI